MQSTHSWRVIAATEQNIHWLSERLYQLRRHIQAYGEEHPVFVLLTKNEADRHKVEEMFYRNFARKYGVAWPGMLRSAETSVMHTRIEMVEIGASVVLMDVGPMPEKWNA